MEEEIDDKDMALYVSTAADSFLAPRALMLFSAAASLAWRIWAISWEYLAYPPFHANCFARLRLLGKATKPSRCFAIHHLFFLADFSTPRNDVPALEYQPPPPFAPLTATDIPHQIGLLRSFYLEKLGDAQELPEEDFDPNLPPMGAMGQIVIKTVSAATKRKAEAAAATFGTADANKKKSKFLPAAKT